MHTVRSSSLRVLTILFVTGLSTTMASEDHTPNSVPDKAIESQADSSTHACPASAPNHYKAREVFNNAVVMQKSNNYDLAARYFKDVKELIGDPNDALYKKADSRLQALSTPDKPIKSRKKAASHVCPASAPNHCKAREAFNNAVVMQKSNNHELAARYFKDVKEIVGDPNDPLYKKADSRLKKLTDS